MADQGWEASLAFALGSRSALSWKETDGVICSLPPPSPPIQSKDTILAPLVTIQHHALLEKEKAKWESRMGKVTLERTGGDMNTHTL